MSKNRTPQPPKAKRWNSRGSCLIALPKEEWATPDRIYHPLDEEFGFTLDACATPENAKVDRYWTALDDGLSRPWEGVVWCNPPYGRVIKDWVRKGYESSRDLGSTVVMLLPASTCTRWFHDYCIKGEIRFIRGRIAFSGAPRPAPFGSMVVIFRPEVSL